MKTILPLFILSLFTTYNAIGQSPCTPIPEVDFPGGRVVMSFDGNVHDDDDIVAMALSAGLWWAAGLQDKIVQIEFNNHLCETNVTESDGTGAGAGDDSQNMRTTASGIIENFGYGSNIFYDYEMQGSASTSKMANEIEKSTASNPLWILAGGPMETVWRGLKKATKGFDYVTIISHSKWNEDHTHCSGEHVWGDLKSEYGGKGVYFVENCNSGGCSSSNKLPDQNGGFNSAKSNWTWMRDSNKSYNRWIYSRNPFGGYFDASDTGMSYFLITGGPLNGGKKTPDHKDVQKLMENPCESTDVPDKIEPATISISSPKNGQTFAPGDDVTINMIATTDGNVVTHQIFVNNNLVDTDGINYTPYTIKNIEKGDYEIRAEVTTNDGQKIISTINIGVEEEEVEDEVLEDEEVENKDGEVVGNVVDDPKDDGTSSFNFSSPTGGTNYVAGETITVDITPLNGNNIVQYQIFVNDALVDTDGRDFTPYQITNAKEGTYNIRAEATDRNGLKTIKTISAQIGDKGVKEIIPNFKTPAVNIISPIDGANYEVGKTVMVDLMTLEGSNIIQHQVFVNDILVDSDPAYYTPHLITNVKVGTYTIKVEVTDKNGRKGSKTSQFNVGNKVDGLVAREYDLATNLSQEEGVSLRIAPNPVEEFQMHVFQKGSGTLQIINIYGISVKQIENAGEETKIDLSGLSPGIYFLQSDTEIARFIIPE